MSDRVAVMRGGRVEQCGEPRALYEEPETAFVANFLGASNLIPARSTAAARWRSATSRCAPTCDGAHRRRAGDDPARARAAGAARRAAARTACRGWSRRSSTSASTRTCACGWRPARWCAATSRTTARRSSAPRATRSRVHLPAECLRVLEPMRHARRAASTRRGASSRRDGLRGGDGRRRSRARRARRWGCCNYHFGSKDEVVAEAFAAGRARGPGRRWRRSRGATRTRPIGWRRTSTSPSGRTRDSWRLWVDAWGESVHSPLRARHARALRRRLARGAGRGARGRRARRAAGRARTRRTRRRGWSR